MANKRQTHGLTALKRVVSAKGIDGLDARTTAVRSVNEWRAQIIADLGGLENIPAAKLVLVEMACRTRVLVDHADVFLLGQASIINRRKKAFIPLVAQRQSLCDSLARLCAQIGLARVPKPIKSLQEHLRDMEAAKADATASPATETGPGEAIVEPEEIETQEEQS
jgi:hypothetical protein